MHLRAVIEYMSFQKSLFFIREYLFPFGCGGCGRALLSPHDTLYGLCGDCRKLFLSMEMSRCEICGKPLISERDTCLSCREKGSAGNGAYSETLVKLRTLFPYTGKFRSILGAYKFSKSLGIGNFLCTCLGAVLAGFELELSVPGINGDAAWVPVPPRPGKIRKQGWDQIDYLAKLLENEYKSFRCHIPGNDNKTDKIRPLPVRRCLKRLRSRSQKELNREERGTNLKGRILCIREPPRTALLFDDVFTTGATLNACAAALLEGGAEKVYGVCLFYD